jgi:hypothetical protein
VATRQDLDRGGGNLDRFANGLVEAIGGRAVDPV